eukprot:GHUV01001758.1.p1 GENE.GHUV01001758.1~~GHUV01001758.1.p1  ORF type:complete len:410 (+),score=149.21 GHUV01001758.1:380-1609(+)
MDPFYPTNLATGALPTTILPDYCFPPQQHQGASAHDLSSLAASMPVPPKQTAEPSGAMPAVQGPSAHQTATLYGAYLHDQACNNQAGMLAAAAAVGTFSREQQQVAFLHELHRRHLQQQAAVHHGGHSTLALEAAAGTAIALQLQQHSYTATGSFARICSNSGSHALAGTAAGIDDSLVLCDETIEMYSVGCSSSSSAFTSHSSMDMESCDDVENRDQQQQQHEAYQATTASKPGALQLLHRVATCRKGYAALNPARGTNSSNYAGTAAAGAEAAGSESVRARLLITEVSVYCSDMDNHKCWSNSPLALAQANELMSSMVLPEDVTYMPVSSDSWIFQAAAGYQFPSFVICLGSSYMQRMLAILPQLAEAAAAVPEFAGYCDYLPDEVSLLGAVQACFTSTVDCPRDPR